MQLIFESMGLPPEFLHDGKNVWDGREGIVHAIMGYLPFSIDVRTVRSVLTRTWEAWATGRIDSFDAGELYTGIRMKARKLSNDEIELALRYSRTDGLDMALCMVNDLRKKKREGFEGHPPEPSRSPVVWETVRAAVKSWGATCHKRQTRATGSRDEYSLWSVFRELFAKQLQEQFPDIPDSKRTAGWPRMDRSSCLFVDEHHEKVKIGKGK